MYGSRFGRQNMSRKAGRQLRTNWGDLFEELTSASVNLRHRIWLRPLRGLCPMGWSLWGPSGQLHHFGEPWLHAVSGHRGQSPGRPDALRSPAGLGTPASFKLPGGRCFGKVEGPSRLLGLLGDAGNKNRDGSSTLAAGATSPERPPAFFSRTIV